MSATFNVFYRFLSFYKNFTDYENFSPIYDTIGGADSVSRQYETLPYPGFSDKRLSAEDEFYEENGNGNKVFHINQQHTLEKHNHYLHQGRQSFR